MQHLGRHLRIIAAGACAIAAVLVVGGCQPKTEAPAPFVRHADRGPKADVPAFMKGTVWELTDRWNDEPYAIASYGLVGRLRGTGDSTASLAVRQWMYKQMARHGYGSARLPGYTDVGAETILRDPNYAIVRVDGLLPPGAREDDFFDIRVTAMPGNKTTSVSGGVLFETELYKVRGNSPDLAGVNMLAKAKGPIVVNPAYALADAGTPGGGGNAKASLRAGVIMDGGVVKGDRPILLRLRSPSAPAARAIENRINQRYQKIADRARTNVMPITNQVAAAADEAIVEVYVPRAFRGEWQHFIGVVEQLTLDGSPRALVERARMLAEEAVKPGAPLMEISYGLEGIGEPAMQYVLPLMVHPNADVSYAMARAAVNIGDPSGAAQDALLRIAKDDAHPFQLASIRTLGGLPVSPERNLKIRELLNSKNTLARTETYKVLARNRDTSMYTRVVKEKFALDTLEGAGDPVIFASRSGIPRIAIIGARPKLQLPITFTTMNNRLMISSDPVSRNVMLFFRDDRLKEPVKMLSRAYVDEIIARLGGEGAPEEERFDFTYGEIVAIVQELANQKKITAPRADGRLTLAPFVFEQPRDTQDVIDVGPVIPDSRPNTADGDRAVGAADLAPLTEAGAAAANN